VRFGIGDNIAPGEYLIEAIGGRARASARFTVPGPEG
jgi:hypothetical protein